MRYSKSTKDRETPFVITTFTYIVLEKIIWNVGPEIRLTVTWGVSPLRQLRVQSRRKDSITWIRGRRDSQPTITEYERGKKSFNGSKYVSDGTRSQIRVWGNGIVGNRLQLYFTDIFSDGKTELPLGWVTPSSVVSWGNLVVLRLEIDFDVGTSWGRGRVRINDVRGRGLLWGSYLVHVDLWTKSETKIFGFDSIGRSYCIQFPFFRKRRTKSFWTNIETEIPSWPHYLHQRSIPLRHGSSDTSTTDRILQILTVIGDTQWDFWKSVNRHWTSFFSYFRTHSFSLFFSHCNPNNYKYT